MQSRHYKQLVLACAALTAFGASAAPSAAAWAPTRTLAQQPLAAIHGLPMRAGELVDVTVSLHLRNQARLDALTADILAGRSNERIGNDEFLRTYAPSAASVQAVVDHLRKSGFINIEVSDNRLLISAEGTAGTVKKAFDAELHHYTAADGRDAYANVTPARVPATLKDTVKAVLGLQTVELARPMLVAADIQPDAASTQTVTGHKPPTFSTIYHADGLAPATNAIAGIISAGSMTQTKADLATFVAQSGFPTPNVSVVTVGRAGAGSSGTPEWDLDSQDLLSAAGGQVKQLIFYTATNLTDSALTKTYNKAVSDHLATVINVSLGECETTANSSGVKATDDAIFQAAVALGQTFSVSTGDKGSYECGGTSNLQSYPAVSPYVMSIGGTTLSTSGSANTTWSGETVWADGGGGPSTIESAPTWQVSSGVLGSSTARGVPDISFDADPSSGSIIILKGKNAQYGGTSLAAPLFAGFWARIQSAHNNALTFPAAALYHYGPGNAGIFHDVTSGNNGGYTAHAGWDYATGFGSLDVGAFASFVNTHSGF